MDRQDIADIAELVAAAMDPEIPESARLDAINRALQVDAARSLAVAASFGQALIGTLEQCGHTNASVMRDLRLRAAGFRTQ